jgi:hypothetical protein
MRAVPLALLAALALAACSSETPADDAAETPAPATVPAAQSDPAAVAAAADAAGSGIPQALQGRWGLVPADCEPGRADAKGLLVIDEDSLEFYESMADLEEVAERSAGRVRAEFAMSGEGMSWEREMELVTRDGGETMTRREFGDEAMPGPLEYARCT